MTPPTPAISLCQSVDQSGSAGQNRETSAPGPGRNCREEKDMDFNKLGHTCVVGMHWGDEGKGKIVD
ncbi:MAG: adenylosuccinate synthetase, partial [Planctomycetes bacterium]|nr:adenylosuccinate synthetase [Planctomycetota bacterium]